MERKGGGNAEVFGKTIWMDVELFIREGLRLEMVPIKRHPAQVPFFVLPYCGIEPVGSGVEASAMVVGRSGYVGGAGAAAAVAAASVAGAVAWRSSRAVARALAIA